MYLGIHNNHTIHICTNWYFILLFARYLGTYRVISFVFLSPQLVLVCRLLWKLLVSRKIAATKPFKKRRRRKTD